MPSLNISLSQDIVNHPVLGDILLEIQGDLEIDVPLKKNEEDNDGGEEGDQDEVVQFGRLEVDEGGKNCVLYVGTKQRLKGKIVNLDPPLAIMKFEDTEEPNSENNNKKVQIVRVLKKKLVFKDRPLPIM